MDLSELSKQARNSPLSTDFIKNGGRLYLDCGHAEYATPECCDPLEAARYYHAGDTLLNDLKHTLTRQGTNTIVRRDNADWHGTSYGFHSNYLFMRKVEDNQLISSLTPFLVSSQILFGSGWSDQSGQFHFSVRGNVLDKLTAHTTTQGNRAIISTRDEPHLSPELAQHYRRLHLTCYDNTMSQMATFVKLGVTSLILSLIEADIDLSDLCPNDPVGAMKLFNRDTTFKERVETPSGKKGVLDIQQALVERTSAFLDIFEGTTLLPQWIFDVWALWADALDDLSAFRIEEDQWPRSSYWIDWWAKWHAFTLYHELYPDTEPDERFALSMRYHDIDPEESLANELITEGMLLTLFSEKELQRAAYSPSTHPRPQERASYLPLLKAANTNISRINWVGVTINGKERPFTFA